MRWIKYLVIITTLVSVELHAAVAIQNWRTPQGANVLFVEVHDLPLLDISVDFAAGSAYDTPQTSGLASMTRHLLSLGAAGMSDNEIARRFENVGANLGGSLDRDRAGFTLRTLSSATEREQAIDTFIKVLQQPDFPQPVLEREKARSIAALKEALTRPEPLAERAFYRALYGTHPYALAPGGELDTLAALQRDQLVAFYQRYYSAANATVVMIGDIDRSAAEALALKLTQGLPAGPSAAPIPAVVVRNEAAQQRIAHPASQSHIMLGQAGVKRGDPDYFPLYLGNYVLGGGGFDSRLLKELRQERGLVYSASSYFIPQRELGPFELGLQTERSQADKALTVARDTLAEFVRRGPSAKELQQAKSNIVGGFPLRIDSNKKILEYLAVIGFYNLPLDYLETFPRKVAAVSANDIRQAFQRRMRLDALTTVIVGAEPATEASAGQ